MNQGISMIVGSGQVAPSTFVMLMTGKADSANDAVAGYACQQAILSTVSIIGISQEGSRYAPTDENTNTYAGAYTGVAGYTGDPIKVYKATDRCLLTIGTAVSPGQLLMPNASGQGIPAVSGAFYGAAAIEGGTAGDLIRVQVQLGRY